MSRRPRSLLIGSLVLASLTACGGDDSGAAVAAIESVASSIDIAGSNPPATEATPTTESPVVLRILVTNDDGVGADGIDAIVQGLLTLENVEVTVVAPLENQSGTGGQTTAGELVVTDTMRERKQVMEDRSDAFITLPGGIGTLEELFETWTAGYLGMHDKPVVLLDPDGHYDGLRTWLDTLVPAGYVTASALERLQVVTDIEAALDLCARESRHEH